MRYSTSNPVMTQNFWSNIQGQNTMTLQGTIGKLAYLLGIVTITALISAYVALDALAAGNASVINGMAWGGLCLLYTSPSPRDGLLSRMPSSA